MNLEGHGREDLFDEMDITRSVGWFTTIYPVRLEVGAATGPGEVLKRVKEQLRAVPNHGIGYGLLRYLNRTGREYLSQFPAMEVAFNYLGQFDQVLQEGSMFGAAKESAGSGFSGFGKRCHLVDIGSWISGGRLGVSMMYSREFHKRSTIESWAAAFLNSLRELIEHCRSEEAGGYTPSDFPLAKLSQEELDDLNKAVQVEDIYPLSPMQEGMLFHTLYAPNEGLYVIQFAYTLPGQMDLNAFKTACNQVVNRYAALKTSFVWKRQHKPLQVVHKQVQVAWVEQDWRKLDLQEQTECLKDYLKEDRQRGFDLAKAPLMRFTLFRLFDSAYRFIWSFHHILLDGWSIPLLLKEILRCYDALINGHELNLRPFRPYRDYIGWLEKQDLGQAERYWRQRLAGFHEANSFKSYWRNGVTTGPRNQQVKRLSLELTQQLQRFCREELLTMNTLMQGTWALLVGRYSQREDVVFGATVSGRPADLDGVETMVGIFLNTLPVRVGLAPHLEVLSWLKQLQSKHLEMAQYEYSPLAQVQSWSGLAGGTSIFESTLVFENYPVGEEVSLQENRALQASDLRVTTQTNYLLTVIVYPGMMLGWEINYDGGRLDEATVKGMSAYMERLLEQIVKNPRGRLSELEMVTGAEREQIIGDFNADLA